MRKQASAIVAYWRRTESTMFLVTVWTVACSSYPSLLPASSLKAQPTNECLSLFRIVSHVNYRTPDEDRDRSRPRTSRPARFACIACCSCRFRSCNFRRSKCKVRTAKLLIPLSYLFADLPRVALAVEEAVEGRRMKDLRRVWLTLMQRWRFVFEPRLWNIMFI